MGISVPTTPTPEGVTGTVRTWFQTVRAVATGDSIASGLLTIDDVDLVAGDRVLLTNQFISEMNGIWVVADGPWNRAADMASGSTVEPTAHVPVSEGTSNADSTYQLTTDGDIIVGTTSMVFAKIAGGGGGGGIAAVVDDPSPELGGDLDCAGNSITGADDVEVTGAVRIGSPAVATELLTVDGDVHVAGQVKGLSAPTDANDAATKDYVDSSGGGGTPGGTENTIQFNSDPAGTFTGNGNLQYDLVTTRLNVNASDMLVSEDGAPALYADGTPAGTQRVGIGTTSPDRKLEIVGATNGVSDDEPQLRLTHTDATEYVEFQSKATGDAAIQMTDSNMWLRSGDTNCYLMLQNTTTGQTDSTVQGLTISTYGLNAGINMNGPGSTLKFGAAGLNAITIDASNNTTAINNLNTNGNVTLGDDNADVHTVNGTLRTRFPLQSVTTFPDPDTGFGDTYALLVADCNQIVHIVNSTGTPVSVWLPAAASCPAGSWFEFKDGGGNAGTDTITIDGTGQGWIDGTPTAPLTQDYAAIGIYSNGAAWFIAP